MMKCFPNPWDVKQVLCAVFPTVIDLKLEKEFLPMIRKKAADKEDITYDDFLEIMDRKALDHQCIIYDQPASYAINAVFHVHHEDRKRKNVAVNRTFGQDTRDLDYANHKQQEYLLIQAFVTRSSKKSSGPKKGQSDGRQSRAHGVQCNEYWGNWHVAQHHSILLAARRSVLIRRLRGLQVQFPTESASFQAAIKKRRAHPTCPTNGDSNSVNPRAANATGSMRTRSQRSYGYGADTSDDVVMDE